MIALVLGVSAALLSYSRFLYEADEMFTNFVYLYTPFEKADSRITIISIDDDTISEYGEYHDWSRQVLADAVNALNENNASIIGLNVDLSRVKDTEGDEALVEACKNAGNVVAIATADYDSADHDNTSDKAQSSTSPSDAANNEPDNASADKNSDSSQNNDLILSKPADSSID